ncbi:hypothetical protein K1720_03125 [Thermococcus argininiproducens]|uniref:DUF7982 domain-containing protein n=1 Tax=Thermococcus argininiproducens TaxID=2866384 RepID=A0A9E7MB97_9EURY|nr:hypothetical protein [Thermococcus argininiproducens]USH00469.1 hypothetical protein K1720_03125 [Thermococcus argininiproducens]
MRAEKIASASLVSIGTFLLIYGAINSNQSQINLGFAGLFLGFVVFTFKSKEYVKREALDNLILPYVEMLQDMVSDLGLEGNALYIPPYENMPEGGTFIPLHEDFDLDLGRMDEETVFLTNVSNERQMGLLIRPTGVDLVKKFEEYFEGPLEGSGSSSVESVASSVLRAFDLARGVYIEESEEGFKVVVKPTNMEICRASVEDCNQVACPVCSSVLLALAKGTGEVVESEDFAIKDYGIEIKAKKLGGVREWM